jgi:hypothetical protein
MPVNLSHQTLLPALRGIVSVNSRGLPRFFATIWSEACWFPGRTEPENYAPKRLSSARKPTNFGVLVGPIVTSAPVKNSRLVD